MKKAEKYKNNKLLRGTVEMDYGCRKGKTDTGKEKSS
jgi:hypothetical protein